MRLTLGEREILVETGQAAEFGTLTPHAIAAVGGPAELIMIFDRDGQRAPRPSRDRWPSDDVVLARLGGVRARPDRSRW